MLPAGSYERAALSLSRHNVKIMNSNDLSTVRAVDICAQSKIEEILHSETRRQMGGGKDIMVHASELIVSFKTKLLEQIIIFTCNFQKKLTSKHFNYYFFLD